MAKKSKQTIAEEIKAINGDEINIEDYDKATLETMLTDAKAKAKAEEEAAKPKNTFEVVKGAITAGGRIYQKGDFVPMSLIDSADRLKKLGLIK